ncbi:hypothetical protein D9758_019093 [Tetrapyrgos nigripes]|uniref:Reverse transcriptase domain-containing protein n=1 Tax=Tetrapyrgos nigripes TaxID=182062 RepID=A0A8H5ET95_9AGAR|nr:hypothetical protein D9758_019093 [Tetrapyrgos nigripes]
MRDQIVEANNLLNCFKPRLNPPNPLSSHFNATLLEEHNACTQLRGPSSPPSAFPSLNTEVCEADIESVKAYLTLHPHSNTCGVNDIPYFAILEIDNTDLCRLYHECFQTGKVPTPWLITLLSALPKCGKDLSDPNNYRAIALKSCFLKFSTLIVLHKLTMAAEEGNLIPPSQNGFCTGHRTHNNAFVLRSLLECAHDQNEILYVAFVDISNAFPSTNHNTLWNWLNDLGLTSMYYDWLQNVYCDMRYRLVQGDCVSDKGLEFSWETLLLHFYGTCTLLLFTSLPIVMT